MARINRAAGLENPLQNVFPQPVIATRTPTTNDKNYTIGQVWIDTSTDQAWFLTSVSSGSATWALSSPGASDVDTLTGDGGGAISPAAGNITLAGGTNITSAGAGSTITFNLDAAITVATSVTTPLYTAGAGVDVAIDAPTGQDILMTLGDNAAANKLSILDSDSVEVFAVDSNGGLTFTSLTVTGAFTQTAGVVSISEDNSANAVGIGNGTTARAIDIGSSAAAHTITMGSATGAASLDLLAGTGNFTLEGATATTYGISTTGANTGTITIGAGTGAQQLDLMTGGTGIKTVNIGTGAIGNVITVGTVTGAASLDLLCGTGNFTLEGNVASTYDISNTGVNTGTVNIAGGTGARSINIGAGGTGAKTINIGAAASADVITIGDATGAGSLDLVAGTGNFTLEGATATTYDISATGANTGTITISGGTGAQTTNIATGGTGIKTVNVGTGAIDNVVTIGTVTGAASLDLLCGTGNFTLEGNVASTYEISSTGANTGTCKFASGTGARTVEVGGGGTGIKTINIGAAATADVITIGTTTGAGSLTLAAGTGNITASGTFEQVDAKLVIPTGFDIDLKSSPTTCTAANTGGVATGATGDTNLLSFREGIIMEQFVLGAGQTIIKPVMDNTGLLISGDLTATEGFEYNFGAARTLSEYAFTVGTSAAFFFEVTLTIADISGGNPYMIGFRKAEANNTALGSYTDYYGLGMFGGTSATNVTLVSELNSGGQTLQDSTTAWTGGDGGTTTLKILVSAAGVVTATIDGGAPGAPLAYTFDGTDVVCPFIRLVHGAVAPGTVHVDDMSVGFQ